jgi:hypothetical protein
MYIVLTDMDQNIMRRYFLGLVAVFALMILIIFLIFHGNGNSSKVQSTSRTLSSYSTSDADVDLTIDGPVTSDENHQSLEITVTNSEVTYQQFQGYQGDVIQEKTYPNNINAFSAFLYALERAGFTEGNNASDLSNDLGFCSLGNRYIFSLNENGQQIERYWATNCGSGEPKTYDGSLDLTLTLFENQVPDYDTLSNNLNI